VDERTFRNAEGITPYVGEDGAIIQELAGRSTGLASHSLARITHPAGTASAAHRHSVADEVYYVASGYGQMEIDRIERRLRPGDLVQIRPGQRHKVTNPGPEDLVLIVTCAPAYAAEEVIWEAEPSSPEPPRSESARENAAAPAGPGGQRAQARRHSPRPEPGPTKAKSPRKRSGRRVL
jgi:mannose-6-phosphate isomerase-like protein (cupin superfamily)